MPDSGATLRRELRQAGLSARAIDAAWPEWWSKSAEESLSARNELRYTLARRLGISPRSLFEGPPRFTWRDDAKFKSLGTTSESEQTILTSFGVSLGRIAVQGTPPPQASLLADPSLLRAAIMSGSAYVQLNNLLAACWSFGIPVLKALVLPLSHKRMHAMTVATFGRFAIILGHDNKFPARAAFTVAHEIGHIALGHVGNASALLEIEDPLQHGSDDTEEVEADRFALQLLTGDPDFSVAPGLAEFNPSMVAQAVQDEAPKRGVSPGMLALSLGHSTGKWAPIFSALKRLPDEYRPQDIGLLINKIASMQFDWEKLSDDQGAYLRAIMGNP